MVACNNLLALDALHVLKDAEELRSVLLENFNKDMVELRHWLSSRQEKKRRKGKDLPERQRMILGAFPFNSPSLSVEKNTGFDLIRAINKVFSKMVARA